MNKRVEANEQKVSFKEDEILRSVYLAQRVISIGEKNLSSRSDYTPLKCSNYKALKFLEKV